MTLYFLHDRRIATAPDLNDAGSVGEVITVSAVTDGNATAFELDAGGGGGGGVSSVTAADSTITIGGTVSNPTVGVNTIPESKVTNLTSDLSTITALANSKVASVAAADSTIVVAGTATAPTVKVGTIAESQVTNLTSDLATLTSNVAAKVASVAAADSTIVVAGTATAPTVKVGSIAESQVTNLTTDLAGKAPRGAGSAYVSGYAGVSYDPTLSSYNLAMTSGALYTARFIAEAATSITGLYFGVQTVGSGLTAAQCFAALYDASGNRLAVSSATSTPFTAGIGLQSFTLPSTALTLGTVYYMAILCNGTTPPVVYNNAGWWDLQRSGPLFANIPRLGVLTSQTSMPSTITLTSLASSSMGLWMGVG